MTYQTFPVRFAALVLCAIAAFSLAPRARAELPAARLVSVFPPGGKQGSTVEVTLSGADLDELTTLHFSDPRITAKPAGSPTKFAITIPADLPVGAYDVRAIGKYGVSNPRTFVIGDLPELSAKPGNTSLSSAAPITVGQTINALAEANAIHYYKAPLKKGQRIFASVDTRSIDSKMEASLILADEQGNDRVIKRRGEVIDFTPPADGDYILKVCDATYRGGGDFFYRLTLRSGPWIDFILPPAGAPGSKGAYTIFGRNLPGASPATVACAAHRGLEQLKVDISLPAEPQRAATPFTFVPSSAAFNDGIDYRLKTPSGLSNPVRIYFATAPIVLHELPPSAAEQAAGQKISPPCEIAGHFLPRTTAQIFTFDAPANSAWNIEVLSNRLGSLTAPFLLIQRVGKDDKGAEKITDIQEVYESPVNPGGPEFKTASHDPSYRLETKEAGAYRLVLRDLFTTQADAAALSYRLLVRPDSPDFQLVAFPPSPLPEKDSKEVAISTPLLRRGAHTAITVLAHRQDNFAGEIQLKVDNLPPGITCAPASIPSSASSTDVILFAAADAPAGYASLHITGAATIAGKPITRPARFGTIATSSYEAQDKVSQVESRLARELFAAVVAEPTPLSIALAKEGPVQATVATKTPIALKITRTGEAAGPLALKLAGHPLLAPMKEITIEPAKDTATIDLDLSALKFPPGEYNLHAEGLTKVKYQPSAQAIKDAEAQVKEAEKTLANLTAAAKTASTALAAIKPAAPERPVAEKASTDAAKKVKDAQAALAAAQAKAKDLAAKSKPRETNATFYSAPIHLVVAPKPAAPAAPAKPKAK